MKLFTIGFTKKTAEQFFETLRRSGAKRIIDVRLHNVSQLAGFAKRDDLRYFLRSIGGIDYVHLPLLAPLPEMLSDYQARKIDWATYERLFIDLMMQRRVENHVPKDLIDGSCLLCSEDRPEKCHRRLVAGYLQAAWGEIHVEHLTPTASLAPISGSS